MLQRGDKTITEKHKVDTLKGKMVFFITGNIHKFNEVRSLLSNYGIAVGMLKIKGMELQSDDITEIAAASAIEAFKQCHLPLIVEDAGLFIETLKGFPGPYSAYVYKTLGNAGILKLLTNVKNRKAVFKSAIVYCDNAEDKIIFFEGQVIGNISNGEKKQSAKSAFGFDPIFMPQADNRTFAQMSLSEKNVFSHRAMSVRKFAEWYSAKR